MPHRRLPDRTDQWHPEPPPHTHPWGIWTTHELRALRTRLSELQTILEEVTDELDRMAYLIEAEKQAAKDSWGAFGRALLSNPTVPYFGALVVLLLATWASGDRKGALETAKSMLQK